MARIHQTWPFPVKVINDTDFEMHYGQINTQRPFSSGNTESFIVSIREPILALRSRVERYLTERDGRKSSFNVMRIREGFPELAILNALTEYLNANADDNESYEAMSRLLQSVTVDEEMAVGFISQFVSHVCSVLGSVFPDMTVADGKRVSYGIVAGGDMHVFINYSPL